MSDYYHELYASGQAHVQAGWRHPFEQAARFALASDLPQVPGGGALLDVGCGPGDLFGHLVRGGWFAGSRDTPEQLYLGVDQLEQAVSLARSRWSGARFVCADACSDEFAQRAETVMAIGAMISGEPCSARARPGRVQQFVAGCIARSTHQGVIMMLDQRGLDERASLGLEAALFGVRRGAELDALIAWIAQRFDVEVTLHPQGLRSDITLYWQRRGQGCAPARLRSNEALAEAVFAQLDPSREQLYWRGWLYAELGMWSAASDVLCECVQAEHVDGARARVLLERIELICR
jgi:SAM-dependent methyltransferase